jgi:ribonuclease VapC
MLVIDTSAFIALIAKEPEEARIRELLKDARSLTMSAVNLFECRTVLHRRFPPPMLSDFEQAVGELGIRMHSFDSDQATLAFAAYRRYGKGSGHPAQLNPVDCAAYALATSLDLPLLFKGEDFGRTDVRAALGTG